MDTLMDKLEQMANANQGRAVELDRDKAQKLGVALGIRESMELVQQHLDAEGAQAEEIAPIVYLGYDPDSDDAPEGHGYLCRDAKGNRYLTGVVWGVNGASHEAREDIPAMECFRHLSFEELAEEMHAGARELLRRAREEPDAVPHSIDGYSLECGLERAVETLRTAMTPDATPDDYPHLDDDGKPGVGVPS